MAEDAGMQSVAMPLVGAGRAGWPAKLAAKVQMEQVLQFINAATAASSLKVMRSAALVTAPRLELPHCSTCCCMICKTLSVNANCVSGQELCHWLWLCTCEWVRATAAYLYCDSESLDT